MRHLNTYKLFENIDTSEKDDLLKVVDLLQDLFDKNEITKDDYTKHGAFPSDSRYPYYVILSMDSKYILYIYLPRKVSISSGILHEIQSRKKDIESYIGKNINEISAYTRDYSNGTITQIFIVS